MENTIVPKSGIPLEFFWKNGMFKNQIAITYQNIFFVN